MKSIELLINALNDVHDSEIIIQNHEHKTLNILINLQRVDGKIIPYQLKINATKGNKVVVSEVITQLLSMCCPERHINSDGTFCLYWEDDIDLGITDIDKATLWWQTLISFLLKQERAKKNENGLIKILGLMVQQLNFRELPYQHLIKLEQTLGTQFFQTLYK